MGLINPPDCKYIPITGQFSTYDTRYSIPYSGIAILHPISNRLDLFFTCVVDKVYSSMDETFDYLSFETFCNQIGIKSFNFNGYSTSVTLTRAESITGVIGRSGLKIEPQGNKKAGFGRSYLDDLSIVGVWSASQMLKVGDQYTVSIIGAKI